MPYLKDIYPSASGYTDPLTTKGDLLTRDINGDSTRLPVGSDGSYLMADSSSNYGLSWQVLDVGFATLNNPFTQPAVNSTVQILISTNRWIQSGMYVYIQTGGVYLVTARSGSNLITVKNLYSDNAAQGTSIPLASIITPAGQRGVDGNNAYTTVTNSFTMPAVNATFAATLPYTNWVNVDQIVYVDSAGYFKVTAKTATSLTLLNTGWLGNTAPNTSVAAAKSITVAGIVGANGVDGINAYSTTTGSFNIPAVNNDVAVSVNQSAWMAIGQSVYIENAGAFTVIGLGSTVTLRNDGASGNAAPGTLINSGVKVSPSGLTGEAGSNALVTQLAASFTQPAINSSVTITVQDTSFLSAGAYIYIPGGGFYIITTIVNSTSLTITNLGVVGNTTPGATVNSLVLICPSGKPGINGVDGADGTNGVNGVDGVDGQSIDHIALTSTTGLNKTYTVWGDVAETVNLGTFTVSNGESGTLSAAPAAFFDIQSSNRAASADQLVLFAKSDGFYYTAPNGTVYELALVNDIPTPPSIGTSIGDLIQLVNVGGLAGLPAVDGSQLTNLPAGGHTIEVKTVPLTQRSTLNFGGDLVVGSDDSVNDRSTVSINTGLSGLGDLLYHNGSGLARLQKGSQGQVLSSDSVAGLTWTTVSSSGDMLKSTYDTDNDGVVDAAEAIAGSPTASQYYGTNSSGTKGFYTLPTAGTLTVKDSSTTVTSATTIDFVSGAVVSVDGTTAQVTIPSNGVTLPTTTKGDLIVHNGTTNVALAVSSDASTFLSPDPVSSTGLAWKSLAGYMLKSVYDTNNDGVVDSAESIAGSPSASYYYGTNSSGVKGFYALPISSSGGHTLMNEGISLPNRPSLDFIGTSVSVSDDPVNNKTVVSVTVPQTTDNGIKLNRVYSATLASLTI